MENTSTPPNPSHSRTINYVVIGVIIAALIYGLVQYNNREQGPPTKEEVASEQASKFEDELKALPADASKEERYSYLLRLARAEYQQGNYEDALKWLEEFPEEDKNYQGVWYTYAQIYQSQGDNGRALEAVKQAVQSTPDNPQPWQLYFELMANTGASRADQEAVYQEALAKTENDPAIVEAYEKFKATPAQ